MDENKELEIKFEMTEDALASVTCDEKIKQLFHHKGVKKTLRSTYFDTPDLTLYNHKVAFRVRRVGDHWVQTVKSSKNQILSGVSHPIEIEQVLESQEPDLDALSSADLPKEIRDLADDIELQPIFETQIERTKYMVNSSDGDEIEFVFDEGQVKAGDKSQPLCEIELELKAGKSQFLLDIAELLLKHKGIGFSKLSKAQRGYKLEQGEDLSSDYAPLLAKKVELSNQHSSEDAFAEILGSVVEQITSNFDVILNTEDPGGPHQLRIGLRRLRTLLQAYRPLINWNRIRPLAKDAQKMSRIVGELRDADVLISDISKPILEKADIKLDPEPLLAELRLYRDDVKKQVKHELQKKRWRLFQLQLGLFVATSGWRDGLSSQQLRVLQDDVEGEAIKILNKSWKNAAELGVKIETLDIEARHTLRKSLKTLRYLTEFFSSIYSKKQVRPFLKNLKQAQNIFGYLNDVDVANKIPQICKQAETPDSEALMISGYLLGWHGSEAQNAWRDAKSQWQSLQDTEKFWLK